MVKLGGTPGHAFCTNPDCGCSAPVLDTVYVLGDSVKELADLNKNSNVDIRLVGHVRDITWYQRSEWDWA